MSTDSQLPKIKKEHTSCHDCCFGVYDGIKTNTQVDCALELIKHYKENGQEILEAYNDDIEFYIINGRRCYFKRTKEWYEGLKEEDKLEHLSRVLKETRIKYMAVIYADYCYNDIEDTVNSIMSQTYPPSFIVIIRNYGCKIKPTLLNELLIGTGTKWRVSNAQNESITADFVFYGLMDIFDKEFPICLKIDAGKTVGDEQLMEKINENIVYDDNRFRILEDENFIIGNSYIFRFFRGEFPQECLGKLSTYLAT